jgi:hypothetical protein
MKSHFIETWGVALGFARQFNNGWLIQPVGGHPTWTWGYEGIHEAFATAREEQGLP